MGVRIKDEVEITVSCAMVGMYLHNIDAYREAKAEIARLVQEEAQRHAFPECRVSVNAADGPDAGQIFLTVTGTSAESGDDGQVGRGNRVNGLITPGRPMSIEAAAGKNPVTHVGKIYNLAASEIARAVVAALPGVSRARCLLVSRIGAPITEPAVVSLNVEAVDGDLVLAAKPQIEEIVRQALAALPTRIDDFLSDSVVFF
jgi:S-adenosylmethionine synthetase